MTKRLLCFLVMLVLVSAASVCYANEFALPVDGVPVSLEEAKQYPGLYIMDGDRFTRIGVTRNEFRKDRFNERLYLGNDAALFDADHEIMSIPNTAQLVVIGITDVDIEKVEITHAGYTVRDAVEIRTDREVVRLGRHSYALLNREDATRYIDRIISLIDQSEWTLSAYGVQQPQRGQSSPLKLGRNGIRGGHRNRRQKVLYVPRSHDVYHRENRERVLQSELRLSAVGLSSSVSSLQS